MKFYSDTFPNLTVVTGGFRIKFKDGVYETDNPAKCDALKKAGFKGYTTLNEVAEIEPTIELTEIEQLNEVTEEVKKPFNVPKRWTVEKILEFAVENNIEIPEGIVKAEAIKIVEEAMSK